MSALPDIQKFPEQTPSSPKKKKKSSILIWLSILTSPFFLIFLIAFIVLSLALFIFFDMDNDNSLSEYGEGEIPAEFIPIYQEVAEKYGIDWILLAAIHKVETNFSRIDPMVSVVGAIGHFQFMPCTVVGWGYPSCKSSSNGNATIPKKDLQSPSVIKKYGGYGVDGNNDGKVDQFNIYDATYTAGNYLSKNMKGKTDEEKIKSAIYAYNHADWYVDEVLYYYQLFSSDSNPMVEIKGNKAWVVPYTKNLTSNFNPKRVHPITGKIKPHNGIDISAGGILGKPVVAYADGKVISSGWNSGGYGYLVIIQHDNNVKTYYGHLKQQGVKKGTKVKAGQIIGYVGSTGASTGPHLHFEIRVNGKPVNPLPYVSEFLN